MNPRRLPALLLALLLALAALVGQARAARPVPDSRLAFGLLSPCRTLDPARTRDVESIQVERTLFEGLVRLKDGGLDVEPCLAESWATGPGQREWTFRLRPGVRFHDGTACNAAAVAFSLQRLMAPPAAGSAGRKEDRPMPLADVTAVEALDELTVRITLQEPHAGFLQGLTLPQLAVVSPAAVAERGKDFARHPVGTGPFVFAGWTPDGTVTVRANPRYWGAAPRLGEVVFRPVANDAQRFHDFVAGNLDAIAGVPPADAARVSRMGDARLYALPGLAVSYLAMNTARPPLDRPEVRRAVNHAVNTQALVRLIYQGQAEPARGILPPGAPGYAPQLEGYPYDPARARQILAEAGLGKGVQLTLWTMNAPRPYLPNPVKVAEAIKGNLEAVGLSVRVVSMDFPTLLRSLPSQDYDLCLAGWVMDTPDPDDFLSSAFGGRPGYGGYNLSNWRDDRVLGLLDQARRQTAPDLRAGLYVRLQEIVHEQAVWVSLAYPRMLMAVRSRVQGLVLQPTGDVRFGEAWKE